ncbi:MAG: amidase [Acidobacteriota bacterium]|nr:amidase [Acidobacteriota bacterium]
MADEETTHEEQPSRRDVLGLAAGGLAVSGLVGCGPGGDVASSETPVVSPASHELVEPLYFSSTVAMAEALAAGDVSSVELVESCLQRIAEVNPALNAVVQLDGETALELATQADAARARGESVGALFGVPMTIKDSLDTAGMISTGGSKGRASFVPQRDATVVRRLREAGAILLGKTNTPEFTLSFETDNLIYGTTTNPWDSAMTSGGSSGGAAAIVAAGGAPFDIGSDYGGSIRLPAHFCGICGIKPTSGRVPRTGHIYPFGGVQDSFQQIGPLAREVDDLTLLLSIIAGPDGVDPAIVPMATSDPEAVDLGALRVSFHTDNGIRTPTSETVAAVEDAAQALASEVASVEEARPTGVEDTFELGALYSWDDGAAVARLSRAAGTTESSLSPGDGTAMGAVALDALIARWWDMRSRMTGFFDDYDVILSPVNAGPAFEHGGLAEAGLASFSYTISYNLTGWPGAVVRGGTAPEGLPIGVQIVARPWREDVALAVAKVLESKLGPFPRPLL